MTQPESTLAADVAASVRRVLEAAGGTGPGRAALDAASRDTVTWSALARLDLGSLLLPGSGAGMVEVVAVSAELGRVCSPQPVIASYVASLPLLVTAGHPAADSVGSGEVIAALAHAGSGLVAGAAWATALVVVDLQSARLLEVGSELAETLDGTRGFARPDRRGGESLADVGAPEVLLAVDRAHLAYVADALGAAGRAFELADEHARGRRQFGVAVGTFQSVQHLLVDAFTDLSLCRAAVDTAALRMDAGEVDAHRSVLVAVALAGEALPRVARACVQVFAGIGYTWEPHVGLFYKRILSLPAVVGSADDGLARLAADVLA